MNLNKKLIFAGVGALATTSVLTIVISCSTPPEEPKTVATEEDKVLALKAEDITPLITKLFDGYAAWTAEQALQDVIKGAETTIVTLPDDIKVECKLTVDSENNIITYKVIEVKKNKIAKDVANAKDFITKLKGEVAGFGVAENQQALVDAVTAQAAIDAIESLFPNKDQDVATAIKIATKSPLFIGGGVKIEFTTNANDAKKELTYIIDKVLIGDKENASFQATPQEPQKNGKIENFAFTENEYSKKLVEEITAEKIKAALEKNLKKHKSTTPSGALKAAKLNSQPIIIDDVNIDLQAEVSENNKSLNYKVSKVSRGTFELNKANNQADLDKLKGIIEGFQEEPTKDYENIFNEIMKTEKNQKLLKDNIKEKIEFLFKGVKTNKIVEEALKDVVNRKIEIANDDGTFVLKFTPTADVANQKFSYKITKLSFGFYRVNDQKVLDLFDEEITGFLTNKQAAEKLINDKISTAKQVATQIEIQTAVEGLFANKNQSVASAILIAGPLEMTLTDGVKVDFSANTKANAVATLEFKVTKLSKDGYELLDKIVGSQSIFNAINGEIAGFLIGDKAKEEAGKLIEGRIDSIAELQTLNTEIKVKIKELLALDGTKSVVDINQDASLKKEVVLDDGIKVEFKLKNSTDTTSDIGNYLVTQLSKDEYLYNNQSILKLLKNEIVGFKSIQDHIKEEEESDKSEVKAITQQQIHDAVRNKYNNFSQLPSTAIGNNNKFDVRINNTRVTASFEVVANDQTGELSYKVTKMAVFVPYEVTAGKLIIQLTRYSGALNDTELGKLNTDLAKNNGNVITGFFDVQQAKDAAKVLIENRMLDAATQQALNSEIKAKIEKLLPLDGTKSIVDINHDSNLKKEVVLDDGIKVEFKLENSTDTTSAKGNYLVTKLSKDGYEYNDANNLKSLKGEITGFRSVQDYIKEEGKSDKTQVEAITQQQIHDAVRNKYNSFSQLPSAAIGSNNKFDVRINNTRVTASFEVTADDQTGELSYEVTRLAVFVPYKINIGTKIVLMTHYSGDLNDTELSKLNTDLAKNNGNIITGFQKN